MVDRCVVFAVVVTVFFAQLGHVNAQNLPNSPRLSGGQPSDTGQTAQSGGAQKSGTQGISEATSSKVSRIMGGGHASQGDFKPARSSAASTGISNATSQRVGAIMNPNAKTERYEAPRGSQSHEVQKNTSANTSEALAKSQASGSKGTEQSTRQGRQAATDGSGRRSTSGPRKAIARGR